ncbi:MAG: BatD family protein [Saprospiraceae bacterium]
MFAKFTLLFLHLLIASSTPTWAQQGSLDISVDRDTILIDEVIKLEIILHNLSGAFTPPNLESFRIVSGPNTSSSYSSINGEVSQKISYTYLLLPLRKGNCVIGSTTVDSDKGKIQSEEINIFVLHSDERPATSVSSKKSYQYKGGIPDSLKISTPKKKRVLKKF